MADRGEITTPVSVKLGSSYELTSKLTENNVIQNRGGDSAFNNGFFRDMAETFANRDMTAEGANLQWATQIEQLTGQVAELQIASLDRNFDRFMDTLYGNTHPDFLKEVKEIRQEILKEAKSKQ